MSIYDAAMKYQSEGTPLVVIAGQEYGTGSSRDWAAKGARLLGVRFAVAQSLNAFTGATGWNGRASVPVQGRNKRRDAQA
jgi:aconitate hydratase